MPKMSDIPTIAADPHPIYRYCSRCNAEHDVDWYLVGWAGWRELCERCGNWLQTGQYQPVTYVCRPPKVAIRMPVKSATKAAR